MIEAIPESPDRMTDVAAPTAPAADPAPTDAGPEARHRLVGRGQGHLLAAAGGARLPFLRRQALLHPVRIDAAGAGGRRPAGGVEIRLWLVVRVADDPQSGRRSSAALVLREPRRAGRWGCPSSHGRLLGRLPERGDVVIVTPPGTRNDYIKRVIGLPGDTHGGARRHGDPERQAAAARAAPLCRPAALRRRARARRAARPAIRRYGPDVRRHAADGAIVCHLPVVTETLPNGRRYDTVELGRSPGDDYPADPHSRQPRLPDGRQSRPLGGQPLSAVGEQGLGGPVPYENLGGRAEFITFSLDGSTSLNPMTWFSSLRAGRAGMSLHAERVGRVERRPVRTGP